MLSPVVLVTGAAKLSGRAMALALAEQGWRVAVHYRDSVEEARRTVADCGRLCAGAQAFRSNLGNETAVRNLLPTVVEAMGAVDAVVHCAATLEPDSAATFSFAALEKHLRSNTAAAIVLGQALHQHVAQRRLHGAARADLLLWLDDRAAERAGQHLSYTLSRAALEAAVGVLAASLQPQVRVQGVRSAPQAAGLLQRLNPEPLAHA